jgi:ABC-type sugar transport system substrate-binding protein
MPAAGAADKLKFAVVPKAMNNPFFDIARDGCIRRAKELDADAPGSAGEAYIGTNNKDLGRALGEMLVKARSRAGAYPMVSGGPAAAKLEMGEKSIDTLLALHDGASVQQVIYTGVDRVTKDNVAEFLK